MSERSHRVLSKRDTASPEEENSQKNRAHQRNCSSWVWVGLATWFFFTGVLSPRNAEAQCDLELTQTISTGLARIDSVTLEEERFLIAGGDLFGRRTKLYQRNGSTWELGWDFSPAGDIASLNREYAFLASPRENRVAVHRFDGANWVEDQVLTPSPVRRFGAALDSDGDFLVVGDPDVRIDDFPWPGQVWIYKRQNSKWFLQQTISKEFLFGLGNAVALEGDRLLIGGDGSELGDAVWSYQRNANSGKWEFEQRLTHGDSGFGTVIALSGDLAIIGSPFSGTGLAHVYRLRGENWRFEQTLAPPETTSAVRFGSSIAIEGQSVFISAPLIGAAHLFRYDSREDNWKHVVRHGGGDPPFVKVTGVGLSIRNALITTDQTADLYAARPVTLEGTVNTAFGSPRDVLFLNGQSGVGEERKIEYKVLDPFELRMILPPAVPEGETAPFVVYAWNRPPSPESVSPLPLGMGCAAMPMPLSGGTPQPLVIWNNARRFSQLGRPTHGSEPAPSTFFRRENGLGRAERFFLQGLIYDPGSSAEVPASLTNGIWAIPTF